MESCSWSLQTWRPLGLLLWRHWKNQQVSDWSNTVLSRRTNFGLEADEHSKLSLYKIYFVKYYLRNNHDVSLYRDNAGKYVSPVTIQYRPALVLPLAIQVLIPRHKGFSDEEDFCHTATRESNTFWKSNIFVHWFKEIPIVHLFQNRQQAGCIT